MDLGTQIRDYAQAVDAEQEPLNLDEIVEHRSSTGPVQIVGPVASSVEVRQRRWWPVAVAVAAVVVLVGGVALFFQVTEPDTPVITQPDPVPTTVPETTPTTVSTIPEPLLSSGWSGFPEDEAGFGDAVMWGVTEGGPGLVAVGADSFLLYDPEQIYGMVWGDSYEVGDGDAVVWTSPDGGVWSRVPHDEAVFGGPAEQQMLSVTEGGPGLVAVGFDGTVDNGSADAAVWTSPDGVSWARVPHDEAVFGGNGQQRMLSVTEGGPGLVAVGFDGTVDSDSADAAVWTSVDGIAWTRVPHDEAVFGGPAEQQMLSVTAGGPGLVAVGSDGYAGTDVVEGPNEAGDAAVWTSTDGFTWSRVPNDAEIFGGIGHERMLSVTTGGPGLVAVGMVSENATESVYAGYSDAAVWTSPDGFVWSRVPHDAAVFGGPGKEMLRQVIVGGPGLVAVGSSGTDDLSWDAAVWTSPDGIAWSRVPHDEPVFGGPYTRMFGVAVGDSGLVAVGRKWGGGEFVAGVWED